ncbi:Fe-S cluster assembly sulfur transfer protein SufU [Secundilactobacillus odoratitofui]|uniref:Fe-S cluster assembly sulfur transfer protein SufU n=1 Tax=Secundilactobacillus odoratitofui TaxID=480930 RepID=UPI0006CF8891|nr:SUF system NifU family Fe-S cluster assembly protein [Secundilactobacillus odoratitofui]
MGLAKLNNLYREVILDHSDHPHHKHALADATHKITLKNPTCGDVINLDVQLSDDDKITDIGFTGEGCTISQSSASMMTDAVMGKSKDDALHMAKTFSDMVMGKEHSQADLDQLEDAAILSNIMTFPARIKCATLAWWALQRALLKDESGEEEGEV